MTSKPGPARDLFGELEQAAQSLVRNDKARAEAALAKANRAVVDAEQALKKAGVDAAAQDKFSGKTAGKPPAAAARPAS
ncbi:MAG TPA: hypothetical protein PLQ11_10085, partial [Beijerinckiaceae bacterium]|nr:hypothetical protein [Beijerinckiaceae bacterium]